VSSVPLILSTTTGLISPQFHVVFNDNFATTACLNGLPPSWSTLLAFSQAKFVDNDFSLDPFTDPLWFHEPSPTTTIDNTSNNIITSTLSSSQREPNIGSLLLSLLREPTIGSTLPTSQRELDLSTSSAVTDSSLPKSLTMSSPEPSGWNPQ
jgi:hypothetical protein